MSMYLTLFGDSEEIRPFTEDKGVTVFPQDVYDAEEATADRDKDSQVEAETHERDVQDKDDKRAEEISSAADVDENGLSTEGEILDGDEDEEMPAMRFTNWTFDAADIAIIDSQIGDVIDVNQPDSFDAMGEGEADELVDNEDANELRAHLIEYVKLSNMLLERHPTSIGHIPGMEEMIWGTFRLLSRAIINVAAFALRLVRRGLKWLTNTIMKSFVKAEWAAKFYNFTIAKRSDKVDRERLAAKEIEAYKYDIFMRLAKYGLDLWDEVAAGERLVFDNAKQSTTGRMAGIVKVGHDLGIKFDLTKATTDFKDLQDNRSREGVLDLGYAPSTLPNIIRYFKEMSKRTPSKKAKELEKVMKNISERIASFGAQVDEDLDKGKYTKESKEFKLNADRLVWYNTRYAFLAACMKLSGYIFATLVDDCYEIFKKYQDSLIHKNLE